jgi:hypothetical protein
MHFMFTYDCFIFCSLFMTFNFRPLNLIITHFHDVVKLWNAVYKITQRHHKFLKNGLRNLK